MKNIIKLCVDRDALGEKRNNIKSSLLTGWGHLLETMDFFSTLPHE